MLMQECKVANSLQKLVYFDSLVYLAISCNFRPYCMFHNFFFYSLSVTSYMKLAISCEHLIPFVPIVRLDLVVFNFHGFLLWCWPEGRRSEVSWTSGQMKMEASNLLDIKNRQEFPLNIFQSGPFVTCCKA